MEDGGKDLDAAAVAFVEQVDVKAQALLIGDRVVSFFSWTATASEAVSAASALTSPPGLIPEMAMKSLYTSGTVVPMTHWICPLDSTTLRIPLMLLSLAMSTRSRLTGTIRSRVMQWNTLAIF